MAAQLTLQRLGGRPDVRSYLSSIWQRRQFAAAIAVGEVRSEHMDTALGNLWHVVNPLLQMGVYYLVFGLLIKTDRGVDNFLAFLAVGVFMFHYTQKSVTAGAKSLLKSQGLIRSIQFPRAILPLSTVIAHGLTFVPAAGIMLVVALATGERPAWVWLLLAPLFLLQTVFNAGGALLSARLADRFPDVQNILPFMFRITFYLSGVLFSATRVTADRDPRFLVLFNLNPIYAFLTAARSLVLDARVDPLLWGVATVWTALLLAIGFFAFRGGEHEYGRG